MRISFGPFAFDRQSRLLWRDGAEVALPPRVLGVLEVLIDRPGQVVARQDLLDGVWKDAFVTDTSLAEAVSFLRQALGDDPQAPRYIQTVHRRGYRFLPPIVEAPAERAVPPEPEPPVSADTAPMSPARDAGAMSSIWWQALPWNAAVLCLAAVIAVSWRTAPLAVPDAPVARFEIAAPAGTAFDRRAPALAVSADGRAMAWAGCAADSGTCAIYVRTLDRLDAVRLHGTDGASAPFFSPDGRWIGFFADGKLKKVAASGGSPSVLADAPAPGGADWSLAGHIAFSGFSAGGLSIVSDQGGTVTALTAPRIDRGEVRHLSPSWLSGGASLAFTIASSSVPGAPGELAVFSSRSRTWKTLRAGVTRAAAAGPGYLVLSSGGDLQAVTIDEQGTTLTGGVDSVLASAGGGEGVAHFAISGGGTLAAVAAGPATLSWDDGAAGDVARLSSPAVSPDSRRIAGVIADANGSDIWIADRASGALTRITYGGTNVSPAWSADGARIFFATRTGGAFSVASRRVDDRSPDAQPVTIEGPSPIHLFPSSVAADGRIAVTAYLPSGRTSAGVVPAGGGTLELPAASPFDDAAPAFSPDGRWLVMESDESGRTEIVVRSAPDGRRIAVSSGGGTRPRWSADGRWILYDSGRRLMRAGFDGASGPRVQSPETVFDRPNARVLAVTPSGRLLIEERPATADRAVVVLQWLRELRQRLPLPVAAPR
jgi:DNA-binding winged helix-turn-helix (wHTH) protein/Tol biopolymer transport system component